MPRETVKTKTNSKTDDKPELPKWLTVDADGTRNVELVDGNVIGGVKVGSVKVRKPKVKERLSIEQNKEFPDAASKEIEFISVLTDWSHEEIGELSLEDYGRLQFVLSGFFGTAMRQRSGEQS